jgi:hypothetical protein
MEMGQPATRIQALDICVMNCVIDVPLTSLWSWQIITANSQFDVYEYIDDKS